MTRYLLGRIGQGVFVLWAAFTLTFALLYLLPSDPVSIMLNIGDSGSFADPEQAAALRAEYGFDRPVIVQYWQQLTGVLQLDLGESIRTGRAVTAEVLAALPPTLVLAGSALLLAVILGVGVAFLAAYTQRDGLRRALLMFPPLGVSLPTFWIGLMLLQIFSFELGWVPAVGNAGLSTLVLPMVTLAIPTAAAIAQVLARSLFSVSRQPYVQTAHAKGLPRTRVYGHHVLRNAALPVLTVLGTSVGGLLAGSVVTETVFSRPGLGRLTQTSVGAQDIPVVQGIVLFSAVVFVVVNLVVDLLYPVLDPRISVHDGSRRSV
ncbi:ABC transporter permease [Nakamurella sp. YIM 132084]|uniref:ABC transporter permease n=1 Tax=Nakamurella leprariae TaxID=2803911 RepID=A0A938YE17_9ACTN|nr:ABC transporter permease [Nakamurella leprariae]